MISLRCTHGSAPAKYYDEEKGYPCLSKALLLHNLTPRIAAAEMRVKGRFGGGAARGRHSSRKALSPASTRNGSVFSTGARGQTQRGLYAHDGL